MLRQTFPELGLNTHVGEGLCFSEYVGANSTFLAQVVSILGIFIFLIAIGHSYARQV
jgi:hypothetical protein